MSYATLVKETFFKVIHQPDGHIGVEMTKPSGRRQVVPDFRDDAEAYAWIIQIQRLIGEASPQLPGVKRNVGTRLTKSR